MPKQVIRTDEEMVLRTANDVVWFLAKAIGLTPIAPGVGGGCMCLDPDSDYDTPVLFAPLTDGNDLLRVWSHVAHKSDVISCSIYSTMDDDGVTLKTCVTVYLRKPPNSWDSVWYTGLNNHNAAICIAACRVHRAVVEWRGGE